MLDTSRAPIRRENKPMPVTADHVRRFHQDGFFVVEDALSSHDLQVLRDECQRFITEREEQMDRLGVDTLDLDHRGRRYFVHAYEHSALVREFLFSEPMCEIARATLGETVYLFN